MQTLQHFITELQRRIETRNVCHFDGFGVRTVNPWDAD